MDEKIVLFMCLKFSTRTSSHRGYIQYDIYDIRLIDGIDFFVHVFDMYVI